MSAKLQPEWVERRANIDPETGARQKRFLVIGTDAAKIASAFSKLMPNCHIEAAARADHAVLAMASGHFDATLVDCREDERFHRLAVVAARQFKEGRVALLASDHFLPDEKAVLDNLDIFGSNDDSAMLLTSLRLVIKAPAARQPDPLTADFEAALRAELDALQNKSGQIAAPQKAERQTEVQVELYQEPAAALPDDVLLEASANTAPALGAALEEQAATPLQGIENASQSVIEDRAAFLDALALELDEIQLIEDVSGEPQDVSAEQPAQAAKQSPDTGKLDLFGHPVVEMKNFEAVAFTEAAAAGEAEPDDDGLFAWFAANPPAPETQAPQAPQPAEPESAASGQTAAWGSLDLFGFPLSDIREIHLNGPTAVSEDYSGNLDLFDADISEPAARPKGGDAQQAADSLFHRSAVPSGKVQTAATPAAAPVAPALKISELPEPAAKVSLLRSTSWLAHLLPRLTPLYSVVYKNLALVILGALFTAFVAFGVMIVFFLTSNKWSAPLTLSRGHELVVKVERELGDLTVRKNQISEQIEDAKKNLKSSQDELGRARSLAGMIEGTITAEIKNRSELRAEIETHTAALRNVAAQYGNDALNPQFKGNLAGEFNRRLINRNIFEAGKLAQLEAAHRTALIRNEIAANEVEISRLNSTLAALNALSGHVEGTSAPLAGVGGADLVPLLNQVIEVRKGASEAASELKAAESRGALLSDSLETVEASVVQIQSTPLARAISENLTVLFVPYENAGQYQKGASLYSCAIGIFFCSEAGKVGNVIEGETVATHPFFNKPIRGSFVEAELTDQDAARKEILHVKRRPLFF
jgi:hypothetical protein